MSKRLLGGAWGYLIRGFIFLGLGLIYVLDGNGLKFKGDSLYMMLFLLLGVACLGWSGKLIWENSQAYDAFFHQFPELNGQMSALEMGARFREHSVGLLIYKDYLISYRTGQFTAVSLSRVSQLSYYRISGSLRRLPKLFLVAEFEDGAKSVALPLRAIGLKHPNQLLDRIRQEIAKDYSHISYY